MSQVEKSQEDYNPCPGLAKILAIGTANPPNYMSQTDYPDFYFRVTKTEYLTELKEKFKHMCEKSTIRKRHFHLTEEILNENPSLCSSDGASLNARQDILVEEIPKLGMEAALKAIEEWGQPKSKITHLIFASASGVDMPGADLHLTRLLGLNQSMKRVMIYQQGCFISAVMLRIAKDIAENNAGSRVLVVSSEMDLVTLFRGPSAASFASLAFQSTNGEGAAALIVGADHISVVERPLFHIVSESQTTIPDSHEGITGQLRETGLMPHISRDVPLLVSENLEKCLVEAFTSQGISTDKWNSLFWIVQPSLPIIHKTESIFGLKQEKLSVTRHVLTEYGNMGTASVFFIMDEMRRRSSDEKKKTTGEGMEWGVVVGYGAGLTIETVILRSASISS
ncbi:hypothetical protein K2173_023089 [Erythroxylum novogranatense]|uniref:Chalcone synthase n=1 Tax=Erythroxylum novogranatense TaxID=1862640 RepID=A0AAV8T9S9_9ROSI|nr:hypothetical protein K2173_023089 [Erythroxylum novogranatense]